MVGQPESEQNALVPVGGDEALAVMDLQIKSISKEYSGLRGRLQTMSIFADRTGGPRNAKRLKSDVEFDSSPEEQIFFEHRNEYGEIRAAVAKIKRQIDEGMGKEPDAKALNNALRTVRSLEKMASWHLDSMRSILIELRIRLADIEKKMIVVVQERDRMKQQASQHEDKMNLARKGTDVPNMNELKERLALKYGCSVEQVDAILRAKQVDVEQAE
jgi:hypothetical protein